MEYKTFDDLINKSDIPVLVDFWADWCQPCHMLAPTIKQIASEYKGRIVTVKVNVDKKQNIAARYNIQSIPTIMMFHKGQSRMRLAGALPYPTLKSEIDRALATV